MPKVLFVDQKETSVTYWITNLTKQEIKKLKSDKNNTIDFILQQLNSYSRQSYYHRICSYKMTKAPFKIAALIDSGANKVRGFFKSFFATLGSFSFDLDGQNTLIDSNKETLLMLVSSSKLSYENQKKLFNLYKNNCNNNNFLHKLLENPTLHRDFQMEALSLEGPTQKYVPAHKYILARNHSLDFEVQEKLYDDKDEYILRLLSSNRNLSLDLQKKMLNSKKASVRYLLARSKKLHKEIYLALAKDKSKTVAKALIRNKSIKGDEKIRIRVLSGIFD